jgi:cysteine desulfurase / selenocysteine lyase
MNTREPSADPAMPAAPEETRLASGILPSAGSALTAGSASQIPTPGLSLAAGRVATAPTLPEGDPAGLTQIMARFANQLFGSPPGLSQPAGGDSSALPAGSGFAVPNPAPLPPPVIAAPPPAASAAPLPAASAAPSPYVSSAPLPAASAAPLPAASAAPHPFTSALDLDAIAALFAELAPGGPGPVGALPLIDSEPGRDRSAPYWLSPEPTPHQPAPTAAALPSYQVSAGDDPSLQGLSSTSSRPFDAHAIAREFPILQERVHGKRLVWLDNAATTQKPQAVIDRLSSFYAHENSNIHRAAHTLAARATEAYETARDTVRRFLHASSSDEIIFVRGATEGINLVAQSWGRRNIQQGDEIVLTWLEHHANIVPWQLLAAEKGARLRIAPVDDRGQILLDEYDKLLTDRTRLVAMSQVSNALGTITPARQMIEMAHRRGIKVLLDGAQAVSHLRVDVQALDCDFYVFSGHKVFAPTGIGAVYGKRELLDAMPPWQGGGNMIQDVTFERTIYHGPPARFEAGTGNIADAVGLGAALDWLTRVGLEAVERHEHDLLRYATEQLATVPGLTMIGTAPDKAGVLSFLLAGHKTQEVGGLLDREGIAVRSGHHCAQPILRRFGVEATVRASLAPYNTVEDIDALVSALHRLQAAAPI